MTNKTETIVKEIIKGLNDYALSFSLHEDLDESNPELYQFAYEVYNETSKILEELQGGR